MRFRLPAQGFLYVLSALKRAIVWAAGVSAPQITGPSDTSLALQPGASQTLVLNRHTGAASVTVRTDGLASFATGITTPDDINTILGSGGDAQLDWSTAQATANCPVFASGDGSAGRGYGVVFTTLANTNKDHDHGTLSNPTVFVHSATDPDSANTEWIGLSHDVTNAVVSTGKGGLEIEPAAHANGQTTVISSVSENLTLSTSGATTDSSIQIPANSFIFGVSALITTTISGADSTTVSIGDATTTARFGTMAALTAGTSVMGITQISGASTTLANGPSTSSALAIRVTLSGGGDNTPSAGAIRLTAHYLNMTVATS